MSRIKAADEQKILNEYLSTLNTKDLVKGLEKETQEERKRQEKLLKKKRKEEKKLGKQNAKTLRTLKSAPTIDLRHATSVGSVPAKVDFVNIDA
jgi:hypothetical protein